MTIITTNLTRFIGVILMFVALAILSSSTVFAQEDVISEEDIVFDEIIDKTTGERFIIVADVSISSPRIISQLRNDFVISFTLSNGEGVQPGVRYAVQLTKNLENGVREVVNQYIYNESLTLDSNTSVEKEVVYSAPEYISGTYLLMLYSENDAGLILSGKKVGEVTLSGDGQYVAIKDCVLQIKSDTKETKYSPYEGVDIKSEEDIVGTCSVTNNFTKEVTVTPSFVTHFRTLFGEVVDTNTIIPEAFTLVAGATKEISFSIPKATKPQSYSTSLSFIDMEGKTISDTQEFHYVMRGSSATIQNIILDKNLYRAGDVAQVTIFWSGSVDSFSGARFAATEEVATVFSLSLVDGEGESCIDDTDITISSDNLFIKTTLPIIKDCTNLTLTAAVKDANGYILDQKDLPFPSSEVIESELNTEVKSENSSAKMVIILVSIFLIFAIIIFIIKSFVTKKDDGTPPTTALLFILLFAGVMLFVPQGNIEAATGCGENGSICVTVDLNSSYLPNASISEPVYVKAFNCGNYKYNGSVSGKIDSGGYAKISDYSGIVDTSTGSDIGDFNNTAPSSPGDHHAWFNAVVRQNCASQTQVDAWIAALAAGDPPADDCTYNKSRVFYPFKEHFDVYDPVPSVDLEVWDSNASGWRNFVTIPYGTNPSLKWAVTNSPDSCTWYSGLSGSADVLGGTQNGVIQKGEVTYSLSCENSYSPPSGSDSVTVSVTPPEAEINVSPNQGEAGTPYTVSWKYRYADSCTIKKQTKDGNNGTYSVSFSSSTSIYTENTDATNWTNWRTATRTTDIDTVTSGLNYYQNWQIECTNDSSQTDIATAEYLIYPKEVGCVSCGGGVGSNPLGVSISQSPDETKTNDPYTISWTSSYANACIVKHRETNYFGGLSGTAQGLPNGWSSAWDPDNAGVNNPIGTSLPWSATLTDVLQDWKIECTNERPVGGADDDAALKHYIWAEPKVELQLCDAGDVWNAPSCKTAGQIKETPVGQAVDAIWRTDGRFDMNNGCSGLGTGFAMVGTSGDTVTLPSADPNNPVDYRASCTGKGGTGWSSQAITLQTRAFPNLTADKYSVEIGKNVIVDWNTNQAKNCTLEDVPSGNLPGDFTGFTIDANDRSLPPTGNFTDTIYTSETYTLNCGIYGTDTITIFAIPVVYEI